jgi:hypothetical protein
MVEEQDINLLEELNSISKIHFLHREDIDVIMTYFAKHIFTVFKNGMNVWLYNPDHSALISIEEFDARNKQFSKNSALLKKRLIIV